MPESRMQNPVQIASPSAINPLSLGIDELARLLSAAGARRVESAQVQADLDAGAPVGRDGRVNLVHYAAWLLQEVQAER